VCPFHRISSSNGTWQSQPNQGLLDKRVQQWVNQNPEVDQTYPFLRPNKQVDYYYLGNLKHLRHDVDRENPVWFDFQIEHFEPSDGLYAKILQMIGDVAIFTHWVTTKVRTGSGNDTSNERETIVMNLKQDGQWLAVHEHLSFASL